MPSIVRLDAAPPGGAAQRDQPRADRRVQGAPRRSGWTLHTAGPLSAGFWDCEPGRWRIELPASRQEYLHLLSGRLRLRATDGRFQEFGPGQQAALIPPGFVGEFEVLENLRKHFVWVDL